MTHVSSHGTTAGLIARQPGVDRTKGSGDVLKILIGSIVDAYYLKSLNSGSRQRAEYHWQ